MSSRATIPDAVLSAYGWRDCDSKPATSGLINDTFIITGPSGPVAVLQRQHPVFGAAVNLDLEAVTDHLAAHEMLTPRLLRTRDGQRWVEVNERIWRAITFVAGRTVDRVPSVDAALSAGELVGRFHRAMSDFAGGFEHVRAGVHDTARHLRKLESERTSSSLALIDPLADEILEASRQLSSFAGLPRRNAHGDLKISNVLFESDDWTARCLIDLDTCGELLVAHELGDALRSWCNLSGEDVDSPSIDTDIAAAALRGYSTGARGLLETAEVESIVPGLLAICVELAARFCVDAYEDCYFGWDPTRFTSRRDHNLVRARGQLALARSVAREQKQLEAIAKRALL